LSDTHIYIGHAFSSKGAAPNWAGLLLDEFCSTAALAAGLGTPDYDTGRGLVKRIS
jgi:hypothetical protein